MCPARSTRVWLQHHSAQLMLTGSSKLLNKLNESRSGQSQRPAPPRWDMKGAGLLGRGCSVTALSAIQGRSSEPLRAAMERLAGLWECGAEAGCPGWDCFRASPPAGWHSKDRDDSGLTREMPLGSARKRADRLRWREHFLSWRTSSVLHRR